MVTTVRFPFGYVTTWECDHDVGPRLYSWSSLPLRPATYTPSTIPAEWKCPITAFRPILANVLADPRRPSGPRCPCIPHSTPPCASGQITKLSSSRRKRTAGGAPSRRRAHSTTWKSSSPVAIASYTRDCARRKNRALTGSAR